jgi:pimeloyl-ACP methyl ester carboxylesterase
MVEAAPLPRGARPRVVYLPGIEGSGALSHTFLSQAESLFPITRLHYPGQIRLSLEEMADGCAQALFEQGIPSAIWLGDSFGSAVALTIAERHPRAASGIILAGGLSKPSSVTRLLFWSRVWDRCPDRWRKAVLRKRLGKLGRRNPHSFTKSAVDEFLSNGHLDYLAWRLRLLAAFDARPFLSEIRVPLLYLGGESDSLVDTHEEAREFRTRVSGARAYLFPGCGHFVLGERPSECVELVNNFLPLVARAAA